MDSISPFEKRDELQRILRSKHFAKAEKKARFLEFVTEQTLLGNADKLNEYLIGVDIYERGTDFNPQTDPIVRVQAHHIRRLLQKYYEEDGKDNPIRLDLPAGHYIPQFTHAARGERANPPPVPSAVRPSRIPDVRTILMILFAGTAGLFCTLWLLKPDAPSAVESVRPTHLSPDLEWFWRPFLTSPRPPLLVIPVHPLLRAAHGGDSEKTLAHGRLIPKESLPEFRDTIHFRELDQFYFVPSTTDFTAVGETIGLVRLLGLFHATPQNPEVKPSRLVNFEEIKSRNTILLGGNQAWSGRIFVYPEGFQFYRGVIWNKHPGPGERPVYKPEFDPVTNSLVRDYGLILMVPNEKKEERILLIYGIYTQGSQAAIEYVTTAEHLAELRRALAAISPDKKTPPRLFQALIETGVENAVPGQVTLVGVRAIPEPES